jgi:hypothetical protein
VSLLLRRLSLYGSTCCKLEVRFGRHHATVTVLVLTSSNCHSPSSCFSCLQHEQSESYVVAVVIPLLELLSQEFLDTLMFWRKFSPILDTLMFWRRRNLGTQTASIGHGEVFDAESVVSGDSVLDIRREKSNDGGLAL